MTIYFTGDTHGALDIEKLRESAWEQRDWRPTADDYLIILGDVGCVYHTKSWELPDLDPRDQEVVDELTAQPWTVLFVDGNHENHDTLVDMDVERWHGGLVHRIDDRLIHLMRGQVFTIDGLSVFTMGGAHSPDWNHRVEGESWWAAEMPDDEEYETARANLKATDGAVDLILTHTCPTGFLGEIMDADEFAQADELTDFLQEVYDGTEFGHWLFGHFHEELFSFSDNRLTGLFETIVELDPETLEPISTD